MKRSYQYYLLQKTTFISALLLMLTFSASAQDHKISAALVASPGISWMRAQNSDIERSSIRIAFEYGVLVDVNFSQNYALHTGLTVMLNGGGQQYMNNILGQPLYPTSADFRFKLQYLNFPAAMKFRTNEIGRFTYYGLFGLLTSIRISARADVSIPGTENLFENENIIKEDVPGVSSKVFNISLHIGGGLEYSLHGRTSLLVGIFFNNGFTNVIEDNDDDKITLSNIGLRAGIKF